MNTSDAATRRGRLVIRLFAPLSLITVGIAIVAFTVVLFGQCVQIKSGNLSSDTHFAQFVLQDVIQQVAERSPNGTRPEDAAGPLLTRVSLYSLFGFVLIGIGVWTLLQSKFRDTDDSLVT